MKTVGEEFIPEEKTPKASDMLECTAYDCPQILRKGRKEDVKNIYGF